MTMVYLYLRTLKCKDNFIPLIVPATARNPWNKPRTHAHARTHTHTLLEHPLTLSVIFLILKDVGKCDHEICSLWGST